MWPSQVQAAQATKCLASTFSPSGWCVITSQVPVTQFPGSAISGVLCVSSGELISDCDPPGRCQPSRIPEDLVSNWEPTRSLVEGTISGGEIAPCLLALAVTRLPLCLQWVEGPICSQLALLCYLLSPLFCEWARPCLRLELFPVKFSLSFSFSLWLSHRLDAISC